MNPSSGNLGVYRDICNAGRCDKEGGPAGTAAQVKRLREPPVTRRMMRGKRLPPWSTILSRGAFVPGVDSKRQAFCSYRNYLWYLLIGLCM